MRNRTLVRIQLLLLVSLVILIVWRFSAGPRVGDGFVQIQPSELGEVYSESFSVERPTSVHIAAVGAFETDESGAPLAVYGWLLNRSDKLVVWNMETFRAERDGVLASSADSIRLDAGLYTAYFTTVGPSPSSRDQRAFLGLKPHWTNHKDAFHMVIRADELDVDAVRRMSDAEADGSVERARSGESVLWSALRVRNREQEEELIRVVSDSELHVRAVAGLCSAGCDAAYIENLENDTVVWEMSMDNTTAAGGWESNRSFDDIVRLGRGIYRFVFRTDRTHAWNAWRANPPHHPDAFGMEVVRVSGEVMVLDPLGAASPLISMLDVGSDEHRTARISVSQPSLVLVQAMGEISPDGTLYDFGYIVRDANGERVWRMSLDRSTSAGGHETNRQEQAIVRLEPGEYTLHFETDDSHAFGDWRKSRPTDTDRWGMILYPLDGASEAIQVVMDAQNGSGSTTGSSAPAAPRDDLGAFMAGVQEAQNDTQFEESFSLTQETTVHIVAMGEVSTNGRYDYGWIERSGTGERVWEMTLENTVHAGGDDRNRIFDGRVTLPAGDYVVHYISDFNHAFNDFGAGSPDRESYWGIQIFNALP